MQIFFVLFVSAVALYEIYLFKKSIIKTVKAKWEYAYIAFFTLFAIWLGLKIGSGIYGIIVFVSVVIMIVIGVYKQGIAGDGVIFFKRNREFYRWDMLGHREIYPEDKLTVKYFTRNGILIGKQNYPMEYYDDIVNVFRENRVDYRT